MRLDVLKAAAREVKPLLARWAQDYAEEVRASAPDLPKALNDRAADCWEPLLAIADLAGGKWPKRARQAALILSGAEAQEEEDTGVMLLADIRDIFQRRRTDRVRTEALLEELASFEERPWCEWKKVQPLSPRGLAKLLRPFGVVPKPYRDGFNNVHKGYLLDSFDDAFGRYLGHSVTEMNAKKTFSSQDPPSVSVTRLQPNNHNGLSQKPIGYKPDPVTDRKSVETAPLLGCNRVTDKIPPPREKKEKALQTDLTAYAPAGDDLPLSDLWDAEAEAIAIEAEEREARTAARDMEERLPL